MRREITSNRLYEWYESTDEFLDHALANWFKLPQRHQRANSFAGNVSKTQVIEMAKHGWPEGAQIAKPIHEQAVQLVEKELPHPLFEASWGLSGSEVDMGRYLSSVPECMIEFQPITIAKTGRVVSICVSTSYSGGIPVSQVLQRGASITALVMALEEMQHSVEIWLDGSCTGRGDSAKRFSQKILVKGAHDVVDPEKTAYWLSHPSVLRRLVFATEHDFPMDWQHFAGVGSGYGSPPFDCERNLPDGTIYMDGVTLGTNPAQFVEKQLTELGLIGAKND